MTFSRKTQLTKQISGTHMTNLNNKQVTFEVRSEIVKAGIFSSDYAQFSIQTTI